MANLSLSEYVAYLNELPKKLLADLNKRLVSFGQGVTREFEARSPVDSGTFRRNWRCAQIRLPGTDASVVIKNVTPYGGYLDEGTEAGGVPWYFPNEGNKGPISRSGKLIFINGRVWAGGKSPSGFVGDNTALGYGGIVDSILIHNIDKQEKLAEDIADAIAEKL